MLLFSLGFIAGFISVFVMAEMIFKDGGGDDQDEV